MQVKELAMSSQVRSQHCLYIVASMASTQVGRQMAWQLFQDKWNLFSDQFKGLFLLARLLKSLIENFASEEKAMEIDNFFKVGRFV